MIALGYLAIALFLVIAVLVIQHSEQKELEDIIRNIPPTPPLTYQQAFDRMRRALSYDDDEPELVTPFDKKAYLKSAKWRTLRKQVLKRDHYTCRVCEIDNVPLEIHHLHYANLGDEPLSDLVTLCRHCHQEVHDIYGYEIYSHFPIIE